MKWLLQNHLRKDFKAEIQQNLNVILKNQANPGVPLQTLSGDSCHSLEAFLEANAAPEGLKLSVVSPSPPLRVLLQGFAMSLGPAHSSQHRAKVAQGSSWGKWDTQHCRVGGSRHRGLLGWCWGSCAPPQEHNSASGSQLLYFPNICNPAVL